MRFANDHTDQNVKESGMKVTHCPCIADQESGTPQKTALTTND